MDVEITPEPSEEEREAILQSLAAERKDLPTGSRWWLAGLAREDGDDQPAMTPRRHRRGTTRA